MSSIITFLIIINARRPVSISILLVLIRLQVAVLSGIINSSWLFLVIALIFLGGIIVIFLYLSTLSISEKLVTPKLNFLICFLLISILVIIAPWQTLNFNLRTTMLKPISLRVIFILVLYLTSALLLAVKFAQSFKGAITKKW